MWTLVICHPICQFYTNMWTVRLDFHTFWINVPDGYKDICRSPLGKSDHSIVHLLPRYQAKIKQKKPVVKQYTCGLNKAKYNWEIALTKWTGNCFLMNVTINHDITDTITSYLNFCESNYVQTKTVHTQIIISGSLKILKYALMRKGWLYEGW